MAQQMQWRLLDYYGGLDDLRSGVLRAPYPKSRPIAEAAELTVPVLYYTVLAAVWHYTTL